MKLAPLKLLAFATLAACGHTTQATPHAVAYRAPVVSPVATVAPVAAVAPVEVTPVITAAAVAPTTPVATPMCDSNGRPLAGNVRGKGKMSECE